ncbi:MAG: hypothetical protein AAB434_12095 [Planctomycetota bacterium]
MKNVSCGAAAVDVLMMARLVPPVMISVPPDALHTAVPVFTTSTSEAVIVPLDGANVVLPMLEIVPAAVNVSVEAIVTAAVLLNWTMLKLVVPVPARVAAVVPPNTTVPVAPVSVPLFVRSPFTVSVFAPRLTVRPTPIVRLLHTPAAVSVGWFT